MKRWELGEAIRYYRALNGWTQEQLAAAAGISPGSVVRLETGQAKTPRLGTVHKLAGALGVDADILLSAAGLLEVGNPAAAAGPDPVDVAHTGAFTAVFQRDGDWWIGYVEELPGANAQERTLEEARESLREAVSDVLEANRELTRTEFEGRDVVREPLLGAV